jgi:HK97 family phage major capsid protein
MHTIEQLKARLVELQEIGKAIQAKADAEKRDLSTEEQTELDSVFAEFENVEADIGRRVKLEAQDTRLNTSTGRVVPPQPIAAPANAASDGGLRNTRLTSPEERARWGFRDFGEFCNAVRTAATNPTSPDARLIANALTTYGSEGVGADGGFAVPPEWRSSIMEAIAGEDTLLARTDQQSATGNSITFPVDETTAWQTTGGILAYWDSEAATMTQSKPSLKEVTVKLHRVTALVPVTDELLEDASAMGNYVSKKAGEKIAFKVNDAIVNGTGAGQPLGIMNAPCKVSVAKVTSQVAATFHADNAVAMMARMPAQSFGRSVWLINQDVVPQILRLGFAVTTAAGTASGGGALYLPPNGLANSSTYGSLLGRPIIVTEACATLGTVGDVILADLSQYLSVVKAGGIRSDTSIHLWFDQNTTAFRFVLRMNGQPWLSAAIARKNGSNTLSHFVSLDTRG